jgi:hypothetical protein
MVDEQQPQLRTCMMKTLDLAGRCQKEATRALRVNFGSPTETVPVEAFLSVFLCDDHEPPEEEMKNFIAVNFETMCAGFSLVGRSKPSLDLTTFDWRPMAEYEAFMRDGLDAARKAWKN